MSFENRYSTLDRALHRLAFASSAVQVAVADLEDRLFAAELNPVEIRQPVFVTALPRAGTTLLLETIELLPEFASHTYRNMPFVLCPMFWDSFSSRFQRPGEARQRAHQDGMLVSADSPEAFEEMIWKSFWRDHYKSDRILPWAEDDPEFFEFLRSHMRKIIVLATAKASSAQRYVSKNNLNIARINLLLRNFRDAIIIVPFREPLQHAASLLRQHQNFLEIHRNDRFARQYMAGIGHYDFGENLRPVDFGSWLDRASSRESTLLSFWLEYWFESYSYLAERDGIYLMCYEDLCVHPSESLTRLGDVLRSSNLAALLQAASRLRLPQRRTVGVEPGDQCLLTKAEELYRSLRRRAL